MTGWAEIAACRASIRAVPEAPARGRADRLFPARLGPREREALEIVEGLPGVTIVGLARALDMPTSQARRLVERLEQRGHLIRRPAHRAPVAQQTA